MNVCWAVSIKCHCQTSSNIAYMCTFVYLPQILNYWLSLSLRPLSHKDLHPYHSYHPSYPHKECPPSRFSGAPSVSVCPGRRAPGLRSTESKLDFTELCHVSAVLFDCNIVKLPIELLQNVAQVLRIMYFLFKSILLGKMIILCNVNQLVHYYY